MVLPGLGSCAHGSPLAQQRPIHRHRLGVDLKSQATDSFGEVIDVGGADRETGDFGYRERCGDACLKRAALLARDEKRGGVHGLPDRVVRVSREGSHSPQLCDPCAVDEFVHRVEDPGGDGEAGADHRYVRAWNLPAGIDKRPRVPAGEPPALAETRLAHLQKCGARVGEAGDRGLGVVQKHRVRRTAEFLGRLLDGSAKPRRGEVVAVGEVADLRGDGEGGEQVVSDRREGPVGGEVVVVERGVEVSDTLLQGAL